MKTDPILELRQIEHAYSPKRSGLYLHAFLTVLCTCLLVLYSSAVSASEFQPGEEQPGNIPATAATPNKNDDGEKDASIKNLTKADAFQNAMTSSLDASADWVDSFFGEERAEIEGESNSLRLKGSVFKETSLGVDFDSDVKLRLVLPNLEKKLHLIVSSTFSEEERRLDEPDPVDGINDNERNLYLSLRYFFKAAERRNLSLRAGIKFNGLTPSVFAGPRYSYIKKNWGSWDLRFIEDVTYFSDDGWESMTTVDFEKTFSEVFFYRLSLRGLWQEYRRGYVYWAYTDLYQTVSDDKIVDYRLVTSFDTYPVNRMTEVLAQVQFRKRFWKKWLFFEISPQLIFRRIEDYDPAPGITLSLEMFFGKDFSS